MPRRLAHFSDPRLDAQIGELIKKHKELQKDVDILTLKLANKYTDSRLRMTVTIADKHIFSSEAARDAYFASNPGELEEGLYVQAGTQFFRYHDEEWVEVTAIIQGPKGEKGEKGDKGDTGPMPGHEWQGTALRFQKPDGTWPSTWVDLKGDPGDVGEHGNENHTEEFITVQVVDAHAETRAALDELGHVYHATLTATLDTDDWTGTEAPFVQIQEVSGILATDAPIVDVVLSGDWEVDEARLEAWWYIYRIVTSNDSITAYARDKPDVALPLQLKVVR